MDQSSTLYVGMDVPQDSIAGADVAHDHHAAVVSRGNIGTRQCGLKQLIRRRQSKRPHLVWVYEAGPCGGWRSRDLPPKALAVGSSRPP